MSVRDCKFLVLILMAVTFGINARTGRCQESEQASAISDPAGDSETQPERNPQDSLDAAFARYLSYAEIVAAWQDLNSQGLVDTTLSLLNAESVLRRPCLQVPTKELVSGAAILAAFRDDQGSLDRLRDGISGQPNTEELQHLTEKSIEAGTAVRAALPMQIGDTALSSFHRDLVAAALAGDTKEIESIAQVAQQFTEVDVELRRQLAKASVEALAIVGSLRKAESPSATWINQLAGYVREVALSDVSSDNPDEPRERGGPIHFTAVTGAWQATSGQYQQVFVFKPDMTFLFIQRNPVWGMEMSRNQGRYRWQPAGSDRGYITIYGQNGTMGPIWVQIGAGSQQMRIQFTGLTGTYKRTMMPMW
ncbi:hypothetical protein [Roseimaritima sediminicola]|uniref:hypothetical protein n=1 Tax=Roseimaritima sediminicola TaxID=2662066 RepID=UPI0012985593|nr:hypothetical protein [Roseimaritima sediminicola]